MFTPSGTLHELYSFFIGFEYGFEIMAEHAKYEDGHHYYESVKSTLGWIKSHEAGDSKDGGLTEFINECGSDDEALAAILDFASNLPPASNVFRPGLGEHCRYTASPNLLEFFVSQDE